MWYGGKDIRIEKMPKPKAMDNEALVKVKAVGICGSELHAYAGVSKRRVPLVMGHKFAGEVAEVGEKVEGIQEGNRVVVDPIIRCGTCDQCVSGRSNICKNMRLMGMHLPGGFSEYVAVPARNCVRLPGNVSLEEGTLVESLCVGIHAVGRTPVRLDDTVVVIGAGITGLMTMQVAKLAGTTKLIIIGGGRREYRLELTKKLGADIAINAKKEDPVKTIMKLTDMKGVDAVLEAVGIQTTVQQAMRMVKKGGSVTVIGMLAPKMELEILDAVEKETEIRGSYGYVPSDFKSALDLIGAGRVYVKSMITHVFPLNDIGKGFEILDENEEEVVKVVIKA